MEKDLKSDKSRLERATKEIIPVAIDDGHAEIKLALPDGRMIRIPSKARGGVQGVTAFGRRSEGSEIDGGYETEEQRFTVSDYVDGEGTRFDDYPFSAINRVLIHHVLRVAGLGGKPVQIATGLPVSHFFQGSLPNMTNIERKSKSIAIPVRTLSGDACADIQSSIVVPEGVAAWVDYSLDNQGKVVANSSRPAAVVDIGGRTTDCVTVLPGYRIDHARSGTGNIGVLDLYEALRTRLCSKFSLNDIPQQALEEAVRTGSVFMWGKQIDVKEHVSEMKHEIGAQILREVSRRIGRAAEMEKVLFVGGGAEVFGQLKTAFPNADSPEHPQFANARGMLKFMMYVM